MMSSRLKNNKIFHYVLQNILFTTDIFDYCLEDMPYDMQYDGIG